MHPERRWDTDEVGHGVNGAPDAAEWARALADALAADDWIAEDPEAHLVPHLERACAAPGSPVRLERWSVDDAGSLVVQLGPADGTGDLDRRSRRAAVFGLVGAVAESRTTIHERADGTFEVITGVLDGDTDFAPHGHRLRIDPRDAAG